MFRGASGIYRGPQVIEQSYIGWARTNDGTAGDTTTQTLVSPVVPGGLMGPNSRLELITDWTATSSAIAKNIATDWGGSNVAGPNMTTQGGISYRIQIINTNSLTAQKIQNASTFAASAAYTSLTKDTAGNVTITLRVSWASAPAAGAETITLLGYSLVHYPGV